MGRPVGAAARRLLDRLLRPVQAALGDGVAAARAAGRALPAAGQHVGRQVAAVDAQAGLEEGQQEAAGTAAQVQGGPAPRPRLGPLVLGAMAA